MNVNRLLTTIVINLLINLPLISAITITDVSVKEIKVDSVLIMELLSEIILFH